MKKDAGRIVTLDFLGLSNDLAFTDIRTVPLPLVSALSKIVTLGKIIDIHISQTDPCNLIITKRCPRYLLLRWLYMECSETNIDLDFGVPGMEE